MIPLSIQCQMKLYRTVKVAERRYEHGYVGWCNTGIQPHLIGGILGQMREVGYTVVRCGQAVNGKNGFRQLQFQIIYGKVAWSSNTFQGKFL